MASKKQYPSSAQDICSRIDVGTLVNKVCDSHELLLGKLYWSEPPAVDSLWKAIRGKEIEIYTSKRSTWTSREKQTDTLLSVAATEDLIWS